MNNTNRYHILKQVSGGRHKMKGSGTPAHKKQYDDISLLMNDMIIREPQEVKEPRKIKELKERKGKTGTKPLKFRFD